MYLFERKFPIPVHIFKSIFLSFVMREALFYSLLSSKDRSLVISNIQNQRKNYQPRTLGNRESHFYIVTL